jgi:hypothetical protein
MASELIAVPGASDGDRYYDPNNTYYRVGRSQSACEAVEHCQKSQFKRKVCEMQEDEFINNIYEYAAETACRLRRRL